VELVSIQLNNNTSLHTHTHKMHGEDEKFMVSKKEGNRTLGRLWHRQGDIIKMDLKNMCFQGMALILVPVNETGWQECPFFYTRLISRIKHNKI